MDKPELVNLVRPPTIKSLKLLMIKIAIARLHTYRLFFYREIIPFNIYIFS